MQWMNPHLYHVAIYVTTMYENIYTTVPVAPRDIDMS